MQATVMQPQARSAVVPYEEAIANLQSAFPTADREVIDAILELNRMFEPFWTCDHSRLSFLHNFINYHLGTCRRCSRAQF